VFFLILVSKWIVESRDILNHTTYKPLLSGALQRKMESGKIRGSFKLRVGQRAKASQQRTGQKQSNFWLTINTNRRITSRKKFRQFVEQYDQVLNNMFDTTGSFEWMGVNMIRFGTVVDKKWIPKDINNIRSAEWWDSTNIHSVRVNGVIEEGKTVIGGRIHSHHLIQIVHSTSLQIDCRKVEVYINEHMENMGVKGAYAHAKMVNQDYTNLLAYMGKDVVDDEELLFAVKEQLHF
jgi:hypothetical protein